ncbi:Uncharacterised protein [Yersinia bercovieri]|nr:Uncharacterised protein [Yersinia bercovieri]
MSIYQLAKTHKETVTEMTKIERSINIGCQMSPE